MAGIRLSEKGKERERLRERERECVCVCVMCGYNFLGFYVFNFVFVFLEKHKQKIPLKGKCTFVFVLKSMIFKLESFKKPVNGEVQGFKGQTKVLTKVEP